MEVGNFLIVKKDFEIELLSDDGNVDKMTLKKGEAYKISYVSIDVCQLDLEYKNRSAWFSLNYVNYYYVDYYEKYFYNYIIGLRKYKLKQINEK